MKICDRNEKWKTFEWEVLPRFVFYADLSTYRIFAALAHSLGQFQVPTLNFTHFTINEIISFWLVKSPCASHVTVQNFTTFLSRLHGCVCMIKKEKSELMAKYS